MNPLAKAIGLLTATTDADVADLCGAERWVALQEIERVTSLLRATAVGAKEGRLALSVVRAEVAPPCPDCGGSGPRCARPEPYCPVRRQHAARKREARA